MNIILNSIIKGGRALSKYINALYGELILWRDLEIECGNMEKAKKLHDISKKYKYKF